MIAAIFVAAVAGAGMVAAAPNPTEPSSTSVFNVGGQCTIKWDADSTKTWTDMNIQLMTGDNWNMIPITTIAQNIDATDPTKNTFTYTCPEVTPTSAIYFYQFSHKEDPKDLLWTTRFTIADANGGTTPPTETTQPDGQQIPWGKGALVDPSSAVPPPAYLSGTQTGGASSASGSGSSSATVVPPTSSAPAGSSSSSRPTTSVGLVTSSPTKSAATSTGTSSAAGSTPSANGAAGNVVPGVMAVVGALFAAVGMF